jgi:hypothetical protein
MSSKIGPITLTRPQLIDGNAHTLEEATTKTVGGGTTIISKKVPTRGENFTLLCTHDESLQIQGLVEQGEIVWVDTSTTLSDNSSYVHRGWYILTSANPNFDGNLGPNYVTLEVVGDCVSRDENDYFEMNYTPGVKDGTTINTNYINTQISYDLNETFTSYDTTNTWNTTTSYGLYGEIFSIGGDLLFQGNGAIDGAGGEMGTTSRVSFDKPWTLEVNMKYNTLPTGHPHLLSFLFGPDEKSCPMTYNNSVVLRFEATSAGAYYNAWIYDANGNYGKIITDTYTSTNTIDWKVVVDSGGYITISVDEGSGYSQKYKGVTWISNSWDCHLTWHFMNYDTTQATMQSEFVKVYNYVDTPQTNIVSLPITSNLSTTPTFNRAGVSGDVPCYVNPTESLYFQTTPLDLYDGCVVGYNSNYEDSTPRLITQTNEVLKPGDFYFHNDILKIETTTSTTTPIRFYFASSPEWVEFEQIGFDNGISLVKPLHISQESHTYQLNETKWTLQRGKPYVYVEHPTTPLTYIPKFIYYHDEITTSSSTTPVTMGTQPYTLVTDGYYNIFTQNQSNGGENGTITGFTTKNNTTITNKIPVDVSAGRPNIVKENQWYACENNTTTGFTAVDDTVISPSTSWSGQGSFSLKVVTNSTGLKGVVSDDNTLDFATGDILDISFQCKGTHDQVVSFVLYDQTGTIIPTAYWTIYFTGEGQHNVLMSSYEVPSGVTSGGFGFLTYDSAQTFYIDDIRIVPATGDRQIHGPVANNSSSTLSGSDEKYYCEGHSIKCECDGSELYEGFVFYSNTSPLTGSHTFQSQVWVPSGVDVVFNANRVGAATITGNSDWQEFYETFTPEEYYFDFTNMSSPATPFTFYVDNIMVESGSTKHNWIPGGTSHDTVNIHNISNSTPMIGAEMHRLYYGVSPIDTFENFLTHASAAGANTLIFNACGSLNDDFTTKLTQIETDIAPYMDGWDWYTDWTFLLNDDDGNYVTPANITSFAATVTTNIITMFETCTSMTGFCWDDIDHPTATAEEMEDFVKTVVGGVQAVYPEKKFMGHFLPYWIPGTEGCAKYLDTAILDTYRYNNDSPTFIEDHLDVTMDFLGDATTVIPELLTWKSDADHEIWDIDVVLDDVDKIMDVTQDGYFYLGFGLYGTTPLYPEGLYDNFPSRATTPYSGSHCIMVETDGYVAGEGLTHSPTPTMSNGTVYTAQSWIQATSAVDMHYTFSGVDNDFTGTGSWEQVTATATCTTPALDIVTTTPQATSFYVDQEMVELGATPNTWNVGQYFTQTTPQGFQIFQVEPTTIYVDKIPASDLTGLGWYDINHPTTSYDYYTNIANEFLTKTKTRINMRTI